MRNSHDGDDKEHATMGLIAALQVRKCGLVHHKLGHAIDNDDALRLV